MVIAFTGRRDPKEKDWFLVQRVTVDLIEQKKPARLYFGGAPGIDTWTLEAALGAKHKFRNYETIVVCPCTFQALPISARKVAERADRIIELERAITANDGYEAFRARNRFMADQVKAAIDEGNQGMVQSFWDEVHEGGTFHMMQYSKSIGVPVQYVKID